MDSQSLYPHYHLPYRGLPSEIRMKIWQSCFEEPAVMGMPHGFYGNAYDDERKDVANDGWKYSRRDFTSFEPSLRPELLRVNKEVHRKFIETWRTSVYILFDGFAPIDRIWVLKEPLPFHRPTRFKALIVRCSNDAADRNWMNTSIDFALTFKTEELILLQENKGDLLRCPHCEEEWTKVQERFWTPEVAQRALHLLLIGALRKLVLQVAWPVGTPFGNYTRVEILQKWKAFYHLDDLAEEYSTNLSIIIEPAALPPLPAARNPWPDWPNLACSLCPVVWRDKFECIALTISRTKPLESDGS